MRKILARLEKSDDDERTIILWKEKILRFKLELRFWRFGKLWNLFDEFIIFRFVFWRDFKPKRRLEILSRKCNSSSRSISGLIFVLKKPPAARSFFFRIPKLQKLAFLFQKCFSFLYFFNYFFRKSALKKEKFSL